MGRAPMVKMSRRMPPTPVAAPWKGSTALGWLWLSTFMTMARPWPISTAPAFSSPGPMRTCGPSLGQSREERAGVLVAAVLAPHAADDSELDRGWAGDPGGRRPKWYSSRVRATSRRVSSLGEWWVGVTVMRPPPQGANPRWHGRLRRQARPRRRARGGGIMPTTLRPTLQMPAMSSMAPLGLASGERSPASET